MWEENNTTGNAENILKSLPREEKRKMGWQLMAENGSKESLYPNGGNNDSMFLHWQERPSVEGEPKGAEEQQGPVFEQAR